MNRDRFGSSHLLTTPLGLGLAALGRPGYINLGHADDLNQNYDINAMEAHAHTVLDDAWESGIRYYDAARSYGKAEAFLSSWLAARNIKASDVTIGSKWGYTYTADWSVSVAKGQQHEVKEHSLLVLRRQIAESKSLLGPHLDLYQIHSATLESGVLDNIDVLNELARLQDSGLLVGITVSGPRQADTVWRALEVEIDGRQLFSSVQATWNLLERSATDALRAAHEAGLGIIIKEALANGRLTIRNDSPKFRRQMGVLRSLAEANKTTVDALAIAAALNQPFADVVLSGAARAEHLHSNVQALKVQWTRSLANELDDLVEPVSTYWQSRARLDWN